MSLNNRKKLQHSASTILSVFGAWKTNFISRKYQSLTVMFLSLAKGQEIFYWQNKQPIHLRLLLLPFCSSEIIRQLDVNENSYCNLLALFHFPSVKQDKTDWMSFPRRVTNQRREWGEMHIKCEQIFEKELSLKVYI